MNDRDQDRDQGGDQGRHQDRDQGRDRRTWRERREALRRGVRGTRRRAARRAGRWYGEGPLHLVLLAASFAVAAYAGVRLLAGDWFWVAVWFVGAALVHDLVLVPLYALADRALRTVLGVRADHRAATADGGAGTADDRAGTADDRAGTAPFTAAEAARADRRRMWLNHVRVPAFGSLLLLLIWFPLISGAQEAEYEAVTVLPGDVFLTRWLLITAALFALSALWLLARRAVQARASRRRRATKGRPSTVH